MDLHSDTFWTSRPDCVIASLSRGDEGPSFPSVRYSRGNPIRRTRRNFGAVQGLLVDVKAIDGVSVEIDAETVCLSMAMEVVGGTFGMSLARSEPGRIRSQAAPVLIAPGAAVSGGGDGIRFLRHLVIALPTATVGPVADRRGPIDDAILSRLCHLIADALTDAESVPSVYADGLGAGLSKRLGELASTKRAAPLRGGLAPRQLRRVLDFLNAHLADDLPLDDMAEVAGLSTSHFSRAFKAATGLPPHQWLLNARCERAKDLLVRTDTPLAEVALDVGFCDQAHFCRSFVRVVGTSPGAWRREHA